MLIFDEFFSNFFINFIIIILKIIINSLFYLISLIWNNFLYNFRRINDDNEKKDKTDKFNVIIINFLYKPFRVNNLHITLLNKPPY